MFAASVIGAIVAACFLAHDLTADRPTAGGWIVDTFFLAAFAACAWLNRPKRRVR